jgi:N-acetyl sugar amidotransferase
MDTTDPEIRLLGPDGCNHCVQARARLAEEVFLGVKGEARLRMRLDSIRARGRDRDYDCVLGLSGGADSSYVAYRAAGMGLRLLAVHLDNGWNSELAVGNIERIVKKTGIDLVTHVVDWEEVRDLQVAFLRAGLVNVEAVTDHAIFALLYHEAAKRGISCILSGNNVATESILPRSWTYDSRDGRHILSVHARYGARRLETYPVLLPLRLFAYILVQRIRLFPLLNYGNYVKADAVRSIETALGWVSYERKHGESRFTHFFQNYYLPTKFGYDKRKAHFSSLICSGQMTRPEALRRLEEPLYEPRALAEEMAFVARKLGMSREELEELARTPGRRHADFPNNAWMFSSSNPLTRMIRRLAKAELGRR